MLREQNALAGRAVDIGSGEFLLTVTAKVAVAHIIGQDKNNVWQSSFLGGISARHQEKCGGTKSQGNGLIDPEHVFIFHVMIIIPNSRKMIMYIRILRIICSSLSIIRVFRFEK